MIFIELQYKVNESHFHLVNLPVVPDVQKTIAVSVSSSSSLNSTGTGALCKLISSNMLIMSWQSVLEVLSFPKQNTWI